MILTVHWAKEYQLIGYQSRWYAEKYERGHILANSTAKLVWDFEFQSRKTTTYRRPGLTLEDKQDKIVWICDMACLQEENIATKANEQRTQSVCGSSCNK